jgi:uncharacterized membrane protein YkvA (DUF1232 family)
MSTRAISKSGDLQGMSFDKARKMARSFKRELIVYQRVLRDHRTPIAAKVFLALAIGYLCLPFDLIPDFIPVIGHLDDAIIVPALVFAALRLVPREIVSEHREQVVREQNFVQPQSNCESVGKIKKRGPARE